MDATRIIHQAPADSPFSGRFSDTSHPSTAREFLGDANALVDEIEEDRRRVGHEFVPLDVVAYLKRQHPAPQTKRVECQTLPARFKREPDIFLGRLRFGRTRLFLSKFIGDLAWRGCLLIVLALPLFAHGQMQSPSAAPKFLNKTNIALVGAEYSARTLDAVSTRRFLARGDREICLPSVFVGSNAAVYAYSEGVASVTTGAAWLLTRHHHSRWARAILAVDISIETPTDIHNFLLPDKRGSEKTMRIIATPKRGAL